MSVSEKVRFPGESAEYRSRRDDLLKEGWPRHQENAAQRPCEKRPGWSLTRDVSPRKACLILSSTPSKPDYFQTCFGMLVVPLCSS
jgi:hypothetical protein